MTLKNTLVALLCGIVFALGWWLFIDGIVQSNNTFYFSYSLPAVFCTLAGIALNMVNKEHMIETDDLFSQGGIGDKTRLWTFTMLTISFVCIGCSVWVLVQHFHGQDWPGVALLLNTILVFFSGVVFFMGRT